VEKTAGGEEAFNPFPYPSRRFAGLGDGFSSLLPNTKIRAHGLWRGQAAIDEKLEAGQTGSRPKTKK
jgi:hypothetical protein